MRWLPLLLLLATTAGCWQPRYFAPRENLNGTGPDGDDAAVYQVQIADHPDSKAEVRVWSHGARARFDDEDQEVVDLLVGFELENNGQRGLELDLDALRCEELMIDGVLQEPLAPQRVLGSGYAGPGTSTRADVVFRPPTTVPRSIDGFAVRFVVRDEDGGSVTESTPFGPVSRQYYYRGPSWGWGWGWGGYYGYYGGPYGVWGPYGGWGWGWGWGYRGHRR